MRQIERAEACDRSPQVIAIEGGKPAFSGIFTALAGVKIFDVHHGGVRHHFGDRDMRIFVLLLQSDLRQNGIMIGRKLTVKHVSDNRHVIHMDIGRNENIIDRPAFLASLEAVKG